MSKLSWREEITISAELGPWYTLIHTDHVEGYIRWSNIKDQVVGTKIMLLNVKLRAYPQSELFGTEHIVAETRDGKFYLLRREHSVHR